MECSPYFNTIAVTEGARVSKGLLYYYVVCKHGFCSQIDLVKV